MTEKIVIDVLGWIGSLEVILAYALVSYKPAGAVPAGFYQWLNLTGALFLIINTLFYHAYPSAFVNMVWVVIALTALWKNRLRKLSIATRKS
ncbi:MAG: hypothetical protein OEY56_09255 [Cyclobacteriaceae bacterium]|nr:hypothetical protein [Cyclobacteriaceae bacterium]